MVMRRRPVGRERPGVRLATRRRSRMGVAALAVLAGGFGAAAVAVAPASATIPGWGFEQVTPVEKGSGAVSTSDGFIAAPDGHRLLHSSMLPYESLPVSSSPALVAYVASRGDGGWQNTPVDPVAALSGSPSATSYLIQGTLGVSRNLAYAVVASRAPLLPGIDPDEAGMYLKNVRTGELRLIYTTDHDSAGNDLFTTQQGLRVNYVSNDGKSVIFGVLRSRLLPGVPDPWSTGGLYSWTANGGLRYEGVPDGVPAPTYDIPGNNEGGPRDSMPLDDQGLDHVYYQAGASQATWVNEGPAGARTTRLVTYSRLVPTPVPPAAPTPTPGAPRAVAAGGRFALIQTSNATPLAGGEPSNPSFGSTFLYRFDAEATDPADELEFVGVVPATARIVQMAQNGKTIAFYSTAPQAGSPTDALHKLFVWREGHGLTHVYSTTAGSSGTSNINQLRRMSDNGKFLSFTDNSASVAASFGMANNVSIACPTVTLAPGPCDQVYRYDIENDVLDCVSCRTDGVAPLGASGTSDRPVGAGLMKMNRYQPRTIADDGTVFLTSADALLPEDRNGLDDVYAWHPDHGGLRLISTASVGQRARFLDASSDGSTVFLASRERLAPTDTDTEDDVYATFAGAGFADAVADPVVAPCGGAECREGFSVPSDMAGPGSTAFAGPGNLTSTVASDEPEKVSVGKVKTVRGTAVKLRVKVPGKGQVRVTGSGIRRASKAAKKAGTVSVAVRLSARAQRTLKRKHRVKVRVSVRFAPVTGKALLARASVMFRPKAKHRSSSLRSVRRADVLSSAVGKGR